jgi:hypothetical protein
MRRAHSRGWKTLNASGAVETNFVYDLGWGQYLNNARFLAIEFIKRAPYGEKYNSEGGP